MYRSAVLVMVTSTVVAGVADDVRYSSTTVLVTSTKTAERKIGASLA